MLEQDPAPEGTEGGDEVAARRTLALFLVAVLAVAAGIGALLVGDREDASPVTRDGTPAVGSEAGTPVDAYVAERRAALNRTEGRRLAVASFTGYVSAEEVDGIVGNDLEVRELLVAFPGGEARNVVDIEEARRRVRSHAERQIAEIERLLPTVDDSEFADFYRSEVVRYQALIDGAGRPDVVHGVVVAGRAGDLRALASRPAVRLVDVGPEPAGDAGPEARGLRPEETVTTGEPPFRP